jgi:hypothetical protein
MKTSLKVLAVALVAGGSMFAQSRLSIGIGVGGYGPGAYPPPAYAAYQPPCPGPDYTWVDGYWGPSHVWTNGYWRAPVIAPRYVAPRVYQSFRGNDRGRDWNRNDRGDVRNSRNDYRNGNRNDNRGSRNSFRR